MKRINAYLTIEAVLVMPVALGVLVLTIYLLFFQYDRCLMEQDVGILALRGCTLQAEDQNALAGKLLREAEKADVEKYLAWETEQAEISLKGSRVTAEQSGSLKFPFRGLDFWGGNDRWEVSAKYRNNRIAPMEFIRNCRRVTGGK